MPDVTLYDHRGNPIKRTELGRDAQTSRLSSLHTEYENHPSRGLTPGKLASILHGAEQGQLIEQCHLFADIEEKDGHVFAEMGKRKRALIGLDWDILPPRNASAQEERAADLAKEIMGDMIDLPSMILDMADAIGYAYSNLEISWERVGREWLPEKIDHRPPSWFTVLHTDRDELRLRDMSSDGQPLQPFGWISHVHKATSGFLPRAGLHRVLAWPFLFKSYSVRDLAEFLEIYGLPLRLGTYPQGASEAEKSTLLRAVTQIGHHAAGIVPEGMMIEFKEAAKGASDPYQAMIDWCERTQSKAILGGTLTSQADGASSTNALGNVHNEVRHDLMQADAVQIARTLTRDLVYPIIALNAGGVDSLRRCPRFVLHTQQPEDLALYSDAIPKLVDIGLPIPVSHVRERLQIPEPDEGEAVLSRTPAVGLPPDRLSPADSALKAMPQSCPHCSQVALKADAAVDPALTVLDSLQQAAADPLKAWLEQIRTLADEAESLDALRDRLLNAYGDLPEAQLAEVMALAFAATAQTGMTDVHEESMT